MKKFLSFLGGAWNAIKPHWKGISGGLSAGFFAWLTARPNGVTADEWWTIIAAVAVGGGLTWLLPYLPKKTQ